MNKTNSMKIGDRKRYPHGWKKPTQGATGDPEPFGIKKAGPFSTKVGGRRIGIRDLPVL